MFRADRAEIRELLAHSAKPFGMLLDAGTNLVAVRDHLGIVPMFRTLEPGHPPIVANSIAEILDHRGDERLSLDMASAVGHIAGPYAPRPGTTFFSEIGEVKPGTVLRVSNGRSEELIWWDPSEVEVDTRAELDETSDRLRELLFALIPDYVDHRPVAATLSSGMDSTTVVAGLAKAGAEVTAVTWASPTVVESDESELARLVADSLGVELVEVITRPEELLPPEGIVTRRATPLYNMFDSLWEATARVLAERGARTLHTGLSGDHLFAGWLSPGAELLLAGKPIRLWEYSRTMIQEYPRLLDLIRSEIGAPIIRQLMPERWIRNHKPLPWLHADQLDLWRERQMESIGPGVHPGRSARLSRLCDGLVGQLAESVGTTTERFGIATNHPLMDRRLVEFALSLPTWLLSDRNTDKLVLRKAMRGSLPDEVVDLGRVMPGELARAGIRARSEALMSLTLDMRAADLRIVDEGSLNEEVAAFMRGEHGDMNFWNALTFEDWLRRWW